MSVGGPGGGEEKLASSIVLKFVSVSISTKFCFNFRQVLCLVTENVPELILFQSDEDIIENNNNDVGGSLSRSILY